MNEYHGNHNHGNRISVAPMNSWVPPPEMSGVDGGPPAGGVVREQDQYMPIANVIRIMRRILPPHAKISDDAKETIQECVSEYISFVTGEANDRCKREQRKTVTAEDVLWAMAKLGFDDYVPPLTLFLNRHRAATNGGGASNGGGVGSDTDTGGPKRPTFTGAIVDPYGGFGPPAAAFVGTGGRFRHPHPYHGMFDPMTVYYPSGSGPSVGQNSNGGAGYDPFAQYK